MPRAALLSLHARVEGVESDELANPTLSQVWGPGFHSYLVAEPDFGIFTIGRLPESGKRRKVALDLAAKLDEVLGDDSVTYRSAGSELEIDPNQLRYAGLTGTVELHWAGSGRPTIKKRRPPQIDPGEARRELARRYLYVLGPATSEDFASWAGIADDRAAKIFGEISRELETVRTPIGAGQLLAETEIDELSDSPPRLLPSGDVFCLIWGDQRELLVPSEERRSELWTSRVWPGALLLEGEIQGTWRRSGNRMTIDAWRQLSREQRSTVESEAARLPLDEQPLKVDWI